MRGGSIKIICEVIYENNFPFIQIYVNDNGLGINHEDQKKLFKIFGFLDSSKEINTKGIGLGLHICKLITN